MRRKLALKVIVGVLLLNMLSFVKVTAEPTIGTTSDETTLEWGLTAQEHEKLKSEVAKANNLENPQFFIKKGVNELTENQENYATFVTPKLEYASAKNKHDNNYYTSTQTKFMMNPTAVVKLEEMGAKFNSETGHKMQIVSGWRPYALQKANYEGSEDNGWIAKQGSSEHQTGWAIDLDTSERVKKVDRDGDGIPETSDGMDIDGTELYKWLKANAHKYGYIERYPPNSRDITGIQPETWHWRYVGVELATLLYKAKVPYEVVYDKYKTNTGSNSVLEDSEEIKELNQNTGNLTSDGGGTGNMFEYDKTYTFNEAGVLTDNKTSDKHKNLWGNILDGKTASIKKEIEKQGNDLFAKSGIEIDLDTDSGSSFWEKDPNDMMKATSNTVFRVKGGGGDYYIEVPKPLYDEETGALLNGHIIKYAINAIEEYKVMLKQAIMVGTVEHSYNVFRIAPLKAVPLVDMLEENPEMTKDGNMWNIKGDVGQTRYNLVYYFHPIFGKIDVEELKEHKSSKGIKNEFLSSKATEIELTVGDKDRGSYKLDTTYLSYVRKQGLEHTILSKLNSGTVRKLELRVNEYQTDVGLNKSNAKDLIESVFPIYAPTVFKESAANLRHYELKEYKEVDGFYISVRNNYVMVADGDSYKVTGGYETYGLDLNALLVMSVTDKNESTNNPDSDTQIKGAITSLWFKEAIYDFAGTLADPQTYLTGRELRFNNDYTKRIKLNDANTDLFSVMTKRGGNVGTPLRYYAFGVATGTETTKEGNISVGKNPQEFKISVHFADGKENPDIRGFIMYRNYNHWNENNLIKYLEAQKVEENPDVDGENLLRLIKGSFSVETMPLTFEEWLRVQEIKKELDKSLSDYVISAVNIICLIFGVLLFIYNIFMIVAYLLDSVGIFTTSALSVLTLGKLRSIPFSLSQEEIGAFKEFRESGTKYVTWKGMVIYFVIFGVISMLFLQVEPILQIILYIFFRLSSILTGIAL